MVPRLPAAQDCPGNQPNRYADGNRNYIEICFFDWLASLLQHAPYARLRRRSPPPYFGSFEVRRKSSSAPGSKPMQIDAG